MGSFDWGELAKSAPKGFEPIPKGNYNVEVTDGEAKTYSTGNRGVQLEITVEDGPQKGKKIKFVNIVFNPENPGTFFGQLRALGIDAAFFKEYGKIDEDDEEALDEIMEDVAEEVIGKRAIAPVSQRTYEGRTNNQVGFFKPIKGDGPKRSRRGSSAPVVDDGPDDDDDGADEPEPPKRRRRAAAAPEPDDDGDDGDGDDEPEEKPAKRSRRAAAADDDDGDDAPAPRRSRSGRTRNKSGEPGLPPGL